MFVKFLGSFVARRLSLSLLGFGNVSNLTAKTHNFPAHPAS